MKRVLGFCFERGITLNKTMLKKGMLWMWHVGGFLENKSSAGISLQLDHGSPGAADPHTRLETKSKYRIRFQQMG